MTVFDPAAGLEKKFCALGEELVLEDDAVIAGYASLYGIADQGGDIVQRGAYAVALEALRTRGRSVKMLWQHDPCTPIGVWDEVREDARGLYVRGRLLTEVQAGREALALLKAGAIDGLSIGYRTIRAEKAGTGRLLHELELWEVSMVTFPMLPEARAQSKSSDEEEAGALVDTLAEIFSEARDLMA